MAASSPACSWGRSPRTRGKRRLGSVPKIPLGTIPAHAGETRTRRAPRRTRRDDPRARGGNRARVRPQHLDMGRSPRTRGKPLDGDHGSRWRGTIPAHAGETSIAAWLEALVRDDPRARGGNTTAFSVIEKVKGRSPRTRGKHEHRSQIIQMSGTIPAHAGETRSAALALRQGGDDPRARGGNAGSTLSRRARPGRSPRTRGKHAPPEPGAGRGGTIPAHAGETVLPWVHGAFLWDDPRARGGNRATRFAAPTTWGRSPRTRGKLSFDVAPIFKAGTIPAHAGETRRRSPCSRRSRDDPRARGGNLSSSSASSCSAGRSPRTRGKPFAQDLIDFYGGTIPAHAGETTAGCGEAHARGDDPRARGGNPGTHCHT